MTAKMMGFLLPQNRDDGKLASASGKTKATTAVKMREPRFSGTGEQAGKGGIPTSVVGGGEGAEALLPGGVPDLKLDHVIVVLDVLELEVDTDRVEKVLVEGVLRVPQQEARLAHPTVPDDQHLEQVVT